MCNPLDRLARLSSAEQFFMTLGIDFDPHVLNVHRLHILKRFNELLDIKSLDGLDNDAIEARCTQSLAQAYAEFAGGTGAKTFKVFQQQQTGFVPLTAILPNQ
ncbi:MAG TPA: nitrogenase-stabilizing/protective protein NifW [Candidatus Omnitrophota bacterium]|nr:nitrogenase-stabilizing/protective protein NifW [Candidatus Omnitrophota bacterium]